MGSNFQVHLLALCLLGVGAQLLARASARFREGLQPEGFRHMRERSRDALEGGRPRGDAAAEGAPPGIEERCDGGV